MLLKLMNEYSLHSAIKDWYSLPGDRFEVRVDDFIVDIVRKALLIEIQTRSFSAIKKKLTKLLENHRVRLVYPIPQQKWIVHVIESGEIVGRRKSPKKGRLSDLFYELVRTPNLVKEDNFSLEVLMIEEEEVRCNDGKGSWRRRGVSIKDRRLMNVNSKILFKNEKDFLRFLPSDLTNPFTNKQLAKVSGVSINLARKITYCLRKMGAITTVGKKGKELIFTRASFER
jgi:ribosomal protein S25